MVKAANPRSPREKETEWPNWAYVLRRWLVVVTGLLLATAALLSAVGKTSDAYEAACKVFPICPQPKFAWVDGNPASKSQAIAQDASFVFADLPAMPPEGPVKGSQRYGAPEATCGPILQNAWKLHNGEIVLDDAPLMKDGWTSPSWVGEPEPPDWSRFDSMARDKFGWTPGFANNRCSKGSRCKLSPDEIKAHSQAVTTPIEDCGRMRMVETNFSNSHNLLTVWIRGKADHKSLWTVTVPVQTYTDVKPQN